MWMLQLLAATSFIVALMVFLSRPMHYTMLACKLMGFGFLVWHSDSGKYFYSLTYKGAVEWMACTYASATIFSNWDKEALAVKMA